MHRADRAERAGISLPSKKAKVDDIADDIGESTDLDVYNRHNKKMCSDYTSGKWSNSSMLSLMEETYRERRKFLKTNPPVAEALQVFPWLKEPSLVLVIAI